MNPYNRIMITSLVFTAIMFGCGEKPSTDSTVPADIDILQKWDGDYPVASIGKLPVQQQDLPVGYISDPDDFKLIWGDFKPGEDVPHVNFELNIVLYYRNVTYFNRTSIFKVTLRESVADVLAQETMSAIPIEDKAAMSMVEVPRAGIKFINSGNQKIEVIID